jgi:hypothetical protein
VVLTRPAHVRVVAGGQLTATVARVVPTEDGARLELTLPAGRLIARHEPGSERPPRPGDTVALTLTGGVRFPA